MPGMEWLLYNERLAVLEIFNLETMQRVVGRKYGNHQSKREERQEWSLFASSNTRLSVKIRGGF